MDILYLFSRTCSMSDRYLVVANKNNRCAAGEGSGHLLCRNVLIARQMKINYLICINMNTLLAITTNFN